VDGIATDGGGNLFIAETTANRARKMTPAGIISTLAGNGMETSSGDGGLAAPAQIAYPFSVAAGCCSGNLFVAGTAAVRKITPDGIVNTGAGTGGSYVWGGGGAGNHARLSSASASPLTAGNVHRSRSGQRRSPCVAAGGLSD